jgi:arylformamidase
LRIYDVTVPITETMPVWPGQRRVEIEQLSRIDRGDQANVSRLNLSSHTGTHVDAPYHFVEDGLTVDRLPVDLFIGPAFVAEVDGVDGNRIDVYDLASIHFPRDTRRLLIKTSNSQFWEYGLTEFERDYVHLGSKTAEWLVGRGIHLIGVDYLSVEAYGARDFRVHHTLLEAGIVILEGLNLSRVPPGPCQLVCLPLKIAGSDGAPARVLVVRD